MGYDVDENGEPFSGRPLTRPSEPGTQVQRSPYSPPVRLVGDEITSTYFVNDLCDTPTVTLARIEVHSQDIAMSTFESLTHVDVAPRQTVRRHTSASAYALRSRIRRPETHVDSIWIESASWFVL